MRRRIPFLLSALVLAAQFIQPGRTVEQHAPASDLIATVAPDTTTARLLRAACYDCHSDRTAYPWYAAITPVNFWLQHHVDEGRREFNMSTWAERTDGWRRHKASEARHEVTEGHMPLPSYGWMHGEARLTDAERKQLAAFFGGLMHGGS